MRLPIGEESLCPKEMEETVGRGRECRHKYISEQVGSEAPMFYHYLLSTCSGTQSQTSKQTPCMNPAANWTLMFLLSLFWSSKGVFNSVCMHMHTCVCVFDQLTSLCPDKREESWVSALDLWRRNFIKYFSKRTKWKPHSLECNLVKIFTRWIILAFNQLYEGKCLHLSTGQEISPLSLFRVKTLRRKISIQH